MNLASHDFFLETENRVIQGLAVCENSSYVMDRNQENVLTTLGTERYIIIDTVQSHVSCGYAESLCVYQRA